MKYSKPTKIIQYQGHTDVRADMNSMATIWGPHVAHNMTKEEYQGNIRLVYFAWEMYEFIKERYEHDGNARSIVGRIEEIRVSQEDPVGTQVV